MNWQVNLTKTVEKQTGVDGKVYTWALWKR